MILYGGDPVEMVCVVCARRRPCRLAASAWMGPLWVCVDALDCIAARPELQATP